MSDKFVTAVNEKTKLVSSVPEHYLDLFPGTYRELSESEIVELRRVEEKAIFGEYRTPAPKAPAKEGGK